MNKKRIVTIVVAVAAILIVGVGVAAAQGGGNGRNDGNLPPVGSCCGEPQGNGNGYGGGGFANSEGSEPWNGQQRGRMGQGGNMNGSGIYGTLPPAYEGELPQAVIDLMVDGWLDEQNAYSVYDAVIAQFGEVTPFVNIQQAEAQHIAAWEFLFDRYGIALPALPEVAAPSLPTLAEACQVAADAEIANFGLYDTMLAAFEDYPDLYQVALSLRDASEFNHLPAFENCAGW